MAEDEQAKREREREQQQQAALEWLEIKWQNKACVVCLHNQWEIGEVAELRQFAGGALVVGGGLYPVVPVTCSNCGNTILFNALVAGVVRNPPPSETDQEGDE